MFSVVLKGRVLKSVRKLDASWRTRLHELFETLKAEPVPASNYDVLKLSGSTGYYRIRLGSYRVQYFVDWGMKEIEVFEFGRRDEHTYG